MKAWHIPIYLRFFEMLRAEFETSPLRALTILVITLLALVALAGFIVIFQKQDDKP